MNKVCEVCSQNSAHTVCDECEKSVCFTCFQFRNQRKLCNPCIAKSSQNREEQRSRPPRSSTGVKPDQAGMRLFYLSRVRRPAHDQPAVTQNRGKIVRHSWLIVPILSGAVIALFYLDDSLSRKMLQASKKLESGVSSVADSVQREAAELEPVVSNTPRVRLPEEIAAISLLREKLRRVDSTAAPADSLRTKKNPHGDGLIIYSPEPSKGRGRAVWIVLEGQAYSLNDEAREETPTLSTAQEVPAGLWTKTGLKRDRAVNQLESILSE